VLCQSLILGLAFVHTIVFTGKEFLETPIFSLDEALDFLQKSSAQFITTTRGRKVDCLACTDQTCCSISSILRRCAAAP
jgi:hypothetical protein